MTERDADAVGFWEGRYKSTEQVWSGSPNEALVALVAGLPPGRALDLGCGEGADSVWLAGQGWRVTAVDVAPTAISRGKDEARRRGVGEARISWVVADLASWRPPGTFELVSACFLHSPLAFPRTDVLRRAASAVVPGGHLLVVAHAEPPPWADERHEGGARHHHDHHVEPEREVADLGLEPAGWVTVVGEVRTRQAMGPHGEHATLRDSVVFLRRR